MQHWIHHCCLCLALIVLVATVIYDDDDDDDNTSETKARYTPRASKRRGGSRYRNRRVSYRDGSGSVSGGGGGGLDALWIFMYVLGAVVGVALLVFCCYCCFICFIQEDKNDKKQEPARGKSLAKEILKTEKVQER
ncbi:uncharacterized protein [Haliotis cracherodii]|uniref:uncharacterized protein n=1 Tax=Haliotis cracherodii TaxID=6455 RepID=UPI0039E7A43A